MTARYFTGTNGALFVGGSQVAKIRAWSIAGAVETLETTTTGDSARTYIYGRQQYSGSCTALYYEESGGALAMSALLENIFRTTATPATNTATLRLQLADTRRIEATVLFTTASMAVTTDDIVSVDLDFQVTGHLTVATMGG